MKKIIIAVVSLLCLCGTAVSQQNVEYKYRGFYGVLDLSYGFNLNRAPGLNEVADTASVFGLSLSGGYQISKASAVGLGFMYVADPTGAYTQLPFFLELRSFFLRGSLNPYAALQVGYSVPLGAYSETPVIKITEGGLYFGLDAGARYAIKRNFAVGGHVGYKMLQSNKVMRCDMAGVPMLEDAVVLNMLFVGANIYF